MVSFEALTHKRNAKIAFTELLLNMLEPNQKGAKTECISTMINEIVDAAVEQVKEEIKQGRIKL